jgi:hypothetical protein
MSLLSRVLDGCKRRGRQHDLPHHREPLADLARSEDHERGLRD